MKKTKTDINQVAENILLQAKYEFGKKNIQLKKNLSKDIPVILADKAQLEEAITNIVINAIQAFTEEGEITVKTSSSNGNITVEISDNGPGIPKENIDKIFRPFYSSKGYGKGTGLGLSIVKRIITEHKGSIQVKSQPNKGTAFLITLPVK